MFILNQEKRVLFLSNPYLFICRKRQRKKITERQITRAFVNAIRQRCIEDESIEQHLL